MKILYFKLFAVLFFLSLYANAQQGFQMFVGPAIGLGIISPQNHYGNEHYELDYKFSPAFGGGINIGYGFKKLVSLHLSTTYQQFNQKYADKFSPGFGDLNQSHRKTVNQSYAEIGLMVKITQLLGDSYIYDRGVQIFATTGFVLGRLLSANLHYYVKKDGMEEVEIPYPGNISPYTSSPYQPTTNDKELFTNWILLWNLNLGMDVFLNEKLTFTPSILGQVGLTDINAKKYRVHTPYKSSRVFFGGINLGMTVFFNR
ncbi:MAG: hypothetical protein M9887_08460 [Chitinophagales bacterium]|nr:hypothetical protein [Chitinophagales bacterium]